MAGAGYKLFNTGDVLTAAQVNTYLMEQTVMVFADAAARTTALTGVVSEGMISYLKDTNAVEVYNGSAWVASDDPNAIQNTIVDAKGDLITATASDVPARLAVGNNGETLVADSSASTGLRWQPTFCAGRNVILNSDFRIWQRGTSFASGTATQYTADRWVIERVSGTYSVSQQTFTPGTAPVAGYEGATFLRLSPSVAGDLGIGQRIEDVRTLANQNVTISFWAKASTNTTLQYVILAQNFGSGGSAQVTNVGLSGQAVSTSWARYSVTIANPSISGKTIGTGSFLLLRIDPSESFTGDFDVWGVQVEAGNVASAFQTATGTLAGELAACQRYYWRSSSATVYGAHGNGTASTTTQGVINIHFPTQMRTNSTTVEFSTLALNDGFAATAATSVTVAGGTALVGTVTIGATGLTQYRPYYLVNNNNTAGYIAFSAEL